MVKAPDFGLKISGDWEFESSLGRCISNVAQLHFSFFCFPKRGKRPHRRTFAEFLGNTVGSEFVATEKEARYCSEAREAANAGSL
jgi:hypothetical protein